MATPFQDQELPWFSRLHCGQPLPQMRKPQPRHQHARWAAPIAPQRLSHT